MKKIFIAALAVAAAGVFAQQEAGAAFSYTASGLNTYAGTNTALSAQVTFDKVTSTTLRVVLSNVATSDVTVPSDVLSGVYFTLPSNVSLALTAVSITSGSTWAYTTTTPSASTLLSNWAYNGSLSGGFNSATAGISSAGLGSFGGVGGTDYGILSAGDNLATGNTGVTGKGPLAQSSMTFTFDVSGSGASSFVGDIATNAGFAVKGFQYGTSTSEPFLGSVSKFTPQVIPEPGMAAGLLAGLPLSLRRHR
jgi:hypothetical protein